MKKKLLSSIIILLILSVGLVNQVNAASNTTVKTESKIKQISLVNSPIISFENDKEKLADVKVKVKDNNKIKKVKIYQITDTVKNANKDITKDCDPKIIDEKNHEYTISNEKVLKGGKEYFLIEATNEKGYYIKMDFTLGKVTNAETKKTYYGVNRAPTITQMKIENKSFSFRAIEYWGMKSLTFKDMNNNMQEVLKENNVQKGSTDYSIPLSKLKANSDGVYRLKIYAKEAARNGEARKINRTVAFKVVEKEGTVPTPKKANPKIDKSTVILGVNGVKLLNVSGTEDKAITWSSSNDDIIDIVLRSETRARIKAKKAGIAVVTVTCDGKKYRSQIVVMEKAATSGYYYTVVDGEITKAQIKNSLTQEQALTKTTEILNTLSNGEYNTENAEIAQYVKGGEAYWDIKTEQYEVKINSLTGNLILYKDKYDETQERKTINKEDAQKSLNEIIAKYNIPSEYELKTLKNDNSYKWNTELAKKHHNIFNEYEEIEIYFLPETSRIVNLEVKNYVYTDNEEKITEEEAKQIAKTTYEEDDIAEITVERSIGQVEDRKINSEIYVGDEYEITKPSELIEYMSKYTENRQIRNVWKVTIKNDEDSRAIYAIDATDGNLIRKAFIKKSNLEEE